MTQIESDVQASIADEVEALRAYVETTRMGETKRDEITARLDRIAALVPQRATRNGMPMSVHRPDRCGFVFAGNGWPSCSCGNPGGWQALYTVAGPL